MLRGGREPRAELSASSRAAQPEGTAGGHSLLKEPLEGAFGRNLWKEPLEGDALYSWCFAPLGSRHAEAVGQAPAGLRAQGSVFSVQGSGLRAQGLSPGVTNSVWELHGKQRRLEFDKDQVKAAALLLLFLYALRWVHKLCVRWTLLFRPMPKIVCFF